MKRRVYKMLDPHGDEPRYIGATSQSLGARLACHKIDAKRHAAPVNMWVKYLMDKGLSPVIEELHPLSENWQELEQTAIKDNDGPGLLNTFHGEKSKDFARTRREALKAFYASPAGKVFRRKISKLRKSGHIRPNYTQERNQKISDALRGRSKKEYVSSARP